MKNIPLILLAVVILLCIVPIKGQTDSTFTVYLPKVGFPPDDEGQGWYRPRVWGQYHSQATADSITIPNGRPIYALFVSGFGSNSDFDMLHFYNFARHLQAHGAYVHYAWWNNLLAPYMERKLHLNISKPGDPGEKLENFETPQDAEGKAIPGEDYQFVADADSLLTAIRRHNPNAMIIVAGHSMGGGAIIHLADRVQGRLRIDILAPIDPVGNRNYPWTPPFLLGEHYYNWTRWRATRSRFLGFRAETWQFLNGCEPTGPWLKTWHEAWEANDTICNWNGPYIHDAPHALTFGPNIVHLFHAWQNEFLFPFDYNHDYTFNHNPPAGGSTWQNPIATRRLGLDPGGWPADTSSRRFCCPTGPGLAWPEDGHGEIVGYRGLKTLTIDVVAPLGVMVKTSTNCGDLCSPHGWPTGGASAERGDLLMALERLPLNMEWVNAPYNPDLCLVSPRLISLFNSTNYTISQWSRQPSGTSKQIRSVFFTDMNNGWVVGDDGLIKHTTDGGNTWPFLQPSGTTNNITDVYFTDANTGWVVGSTGLIRHTTNGGDTWTSQLPGTSRTLYGVYFTDANTGWIVGNDGLIKHTTDGGNTWPFLQQSGTTNNIYGVYFTDANTGWVVGVGGVIRHTTNGGTTWTSQLGGTSRTITAVYFTDANTGWIVGVDGLLKHTTDGGNTWNLQFSGTSRDLSDVYFTDANTGWVVGSNGFITHTTDGGTTWNQQITGRLNSLSAVYFTDVNTGWAIGSGGLILHTTNGGVTFVEEEEIYEMPTGYNLSHNYPNPFNPSTIIRYSVPQSSNVVIRVFDILGNEIEKLINEEKPAGSYEVEFNAAELPSGIYFYQIRAGNFVETKKMVLLK